MIFTLESTECFFYDRKDIEEMEQLKIFGFTFRERDDRPGEYMINGNPTIEIDTIESFFDFVDKYGPVVLSPGERTIEIYNGYRE